MRAQMNEWVIDTNGLTEVFIRARWKYMLYVVYLSRLFGERSSQSWDLRVQVNQL
jgi:hypothetical protein